MKLTYAQQDRAAGVLIASAAGDALGAGYEFAHVDRALLPRMVGGGLGDFAPGEWTDDTAQAVAISEAAAKGWDLRSIQALDHVAQRFADWYAGGPSDVGLQTRSILARAGRNPSAAAMAEVAQDEHRARGRSAGNGSLMRTGPVALAHLDDPVALVEAAQAISALTHFEDHAREASAVWSLMIRHAVLHGEFPTFDDIAEWVPNRAKWADILREAQDNAPSTFTNNSWAIGAFQAAWAAITHTRDTRDCRHLVESLYVAIRIGGDTDTVAAIAGALLGARWGMSAVPAEWRRVLHGWPGVSGHELERLAILAINGGESIAYGWPLVDHIDFAALQYGVPTRVRHPHDDGVWLASATELDDMTTAVDAVVSLCLTGRTQVPTHVEHVNFRIIDNPASEANPNVDFALVDAARTVAALRAEGKSVLLHCVAAHSRTPTVAVAYAMLRGVPLERAMSDVLNALPDASPNPAFRDALKRLSTRGDLAT